MTLRTCAAALLGSSLLLGGCQSTRPLETTEVAVDFAFAGVFSVPIPAGYSVREHNGIQVYGEWSNTYPGLAEPVTFALGRVVANRTPEGFAHSIYSCIAGCEQVAVEGTWERLELAYMIERIRTGGVFEPDTITHREYAEGGSECTYYRGIRQDDGLRADLTLCAEQYVAPDGSLDMRVLLAGDETLVPRAVNALLATLPP